MNETEFKKQWEIDKPIYKAWGDFVTNSIKKSLESNGKKLDEFLKIPTKVRIKDDSTLIDKAFYSLHKSYADPYNEIEDKVGTRFVVLLLQDIKDICSIVEESTDWVFDACKHFDDDKEKNPLLFTYQSVHYILRPKSDIKTSGVKIPKSTTCELQIRTLLQHAHAELTHDAIYKAKKTIKPKVHRTVAKSMALIETTDDFFTSVTEQLNFGPLKEHNIIDRLDNLYFHLTKMKPHQQKSSIVIWDEFEQVIDENLVDNIQSLFTDSNYTHLLDKIKNQFLENVLYQQSTVLFIYWMLKNKKRRLLKDWPFQPSLLQPLALDLGVSTWDD